MTAYDLLTERFLPALPVGGGPPRAYSLRQVVAGAHDIAQVRGDTPLQTASIMRLLIALVRRAFAATDRARWRDLWRAGRLPESDLDLYLSRPDCVGKFDLARPEAPFYQCAGLVTDQQITVNRLVFDAASGNNPTLFDHSTDGRVPTFSAAEAARLIITAQSHAVGGGVASAARIDSREYERPNLTHGPAFAGITYWIEADNLLQTLLLNISTTIEQPDDGADDAPWWEYGDWSKLLGAASGGRSRSVEYPRGPCDRLTFQSRLVRLIWQVDEASGCPVCSRMYYTQGRTIASQTDDPFKAERKGKDSWYPMAVNPDKAGWRDVHALLGPGSGQFRPPEPIRNTTARLRLGDIVGARFALNCAGAASDKAKIILWRHDRFQVPADLLSDENAPGRIAEATAIAERRADAMQSELKAIIRIYVAPDHVGVDGKKNLSARQPEEKDVSALFSQIDPREQYWSALEIWFAELLQALGDPERNENALSGWRARVEREKELAMATAIDALGQGPRAWRARGKFEAVRRSTEQKAATSIGNGRE